MANPQAGMHSNAPLELTVLHRQRFFEISFLLQDGQGACRIELPFFDEVSRRVLRRTSGTPSRDSSAARRLLTADTDFPQFLAASVWL
ncbi:hypothetical protein [Arthrobacter pascens]|uniref:hypothetical protein n=1 Tax=Arthrobacter pascens TaxID=1677 RepID=UPI004038AF7C